MGSPTVIKRELKVFLLLVETEMGETTWQPCVSSSRIDCSSRASGWHDKREKLIDVQEINISLKKIKSFHSLARTR
jgi:hypothetical protein